VILSIGIALAVSGLGLVAFSKSLQWIHAGAYMVPVGVIYLVLYMVFHKEEWEKK